MHGAYASKDPKEAAQFGVKVIVVDVPRPRYMLPDIKPGDPLPTMEEIIKMQGNGHKLQE